ncbi:MAG: hypothetical protein ACXWJZ_01480 [Burkholderiaceae bacterium]
MSGFGLAQIKESGKSMKVDSAYIGEEPAIKTTWFEFDVEDSRIQEVVDHLKKIGIDYDPRSF